VCFSNSEHESEQTREENQRYQMKKGEVAKPKPKNCHILHNDLEKNANSATLPLTARSVEIINQPYSGGSTKI